MMALRSSSIATYLECPRKAHYVYIEGRRGRTVPAMAIGTMAHAGVESLLRSKMRGADGIDAALCASSVEPDGVDWAGQDGERVHAADRASAMVRTYAAEVAPSVTPIDAERRIETRLGGVPVSGTIDVVEPLRIRDTKTTRRSPTLWGDPKHRFQLGLYAALVESACFDCDPKTAVIDYLVLSERKPRATKAVPDPAIERTVRYLPVVLDEADLHAEKMSSMVVLADVARRAAAGEYPRNPLACTSWLRACEFLSECYPERFRVASAVVLDEVGNG